ncbi:MAG: aldehyde dehydrogenase [Bacillota bacterium]|nr:aldehyde dehydrogenase [Bacillota bacterium]MDW7678627.1 aldehyde dehydrogenase [Bacillota bacterium]
MDEKQQSAEKEMQEIRQLVEAQRQFYDSGQTRPVLFRIRQLRALKRMVKDHEEEVLEALYKDLKKPRFEAWVAELALFYEEVNIAISHVRGWCRRTKVKTPLALEPSSSWIQPEPKGLVLIIGPWNYPFQLVMQPLVGAMAAGNCVIVKPSDKTPHTSNLLAALVAETFDPAYVAALQGPGAMMGPRLIEPHRFDHIFFTGSTQVGKKILAMAAPHLTPVTLELGGKNPVIVMQDANLEVAARRIIWAKHLNAGQVCIAPDYLLVHESVKDRLVGKMIQAIHDFFGEDPIASDSYGRIISRNRLEILAGYLKDGQILTGGQVDSDSLYMAPTLMDGVRLDSPVMQEEIFGPILPIFTFRELEEVVSMVRRNRSSLAAYLYTDHRKTENELLEKLEFGGGCINNCIVHAGNPNLPFGGVGNSGMGRYHGKASFDLFTNHKAMMRSGTWLDPDMKYAPYTDNKLDLVKQLL